MNDLSVYNTFKTTNVSISQCITAEGQYAVLLVSQNKQQLVLCNSASEQATKFASNVKWYRGY